MVPAHITFSSDGLGHFQIIAVEGGLHCKFESDRVEFSWVGDDDGDSTNGRGWAEITKAVTLEGRIYFHQGDDSAFTARRNRTK